MTATPNYSPKPPRFASFFSVFCSKVTKSSRRKLAAFLRKQPGFIGKIIDDGKVQGVFRNDLDSMVTAHMILGNLSGATQQSLANRSLTLTALLGEAKSMTMARISR